MKLDNKIMSESEQRLLCAGCRIICVTLSQDECQRCIYRVYTSDGGFTQYIGFDKLPKGIKDWLSERNAFEYTLPGCMFVSGCKVV